MARTPEQLRSSHSTTNYRRRSHRSPPFLCYAPIQPQLWALFKLQTTPYNAANADPIDAKHQFAKLSLSDICISQKGHSNSVISLLSLNCYVSRMMLNWRKTDGDTLHTINVPCKHNKKTFTLQNMWKAVSHLWWRNFLSKGWSTKALWFLSSSVLPNCCYPTLEHFANASALTHIGLPRNASHSFWVTVSPSRKISLVSLLTKVRPSDQ